MPDAGWIGFREPCSTWTHLLGAVAAAIATVELVSATRGGLPRRAAMLSYGLAMTATFAASALFHALPRPPGDIWRLLDHCAIYLMIAGTNCPIHQTFLPGARGRSTNTLMWSLAGLGIVGKLFWMDAPHWLSVAIYIALGLTGFISYGPVTRILGSSPVRWVFAGGGFYIAGAMLDIIHWPVVVPGVWESHETWHVFVLAGSFCFYMFIRRHVAGFPDAAMAQPAPSIAGAAHPVPAAAPATA